MRERMREGGRAPTVVGGISLLVIFAVLCLTVFAVLSLLMLIPPALRYNDKILPWALILLVIASWIDKSLGLLIGGFVPNMFETVTEYTPTIPEILVALGVYGLGGIIISVLWKIAMDVKKENGTFALKDN